jgi:phosphate starvation-inducible PhoH-like protein
LTHIAASSAGHPRPSPVPPAAIGAGKSVTLHFNDNTLLALLLGDHDRHLVRLEQGLGVRLACRGNRVSLAGDSSRVDAAQAVLTGLYKRLERGEGLGMSDVDGAIRMAEVDDPRLPLSDLPAIRTRRGAIGPRSPGQATYMEMLGRHEMVFGIGPAGTGKTYLAVAQAGGSASCPATSRRRWTRICVRCTTRWAT